MQRKNGIEQMTLVHQNDDQKGKANQNNNTGTTQTVSYEVKAPSVQPVPSNSAQVSSNDKPQEGNVGEDIPQPSQSAATVHSDIVSLHVTEEEDLEEASLSVDANNAKRRRMEEEEGEEIVEEVVQNTTRKKRTPKKRVGKKASLQPIIGLVGKPEPSAKKMWEDTVLAVPALVAMVTEISSGNQKVNAGAQEASQEESEHSGNRRGRARRPNYKS